MPLLRVTEEEGHPEHDPYITKMKRGKDGGREGGREGRREEEEERGEEVHLHQKKYDSLVEP